MPERVFREMLQEKWTQEKFVCVGLDSEFGKIPGCIRENHTHAESIHGFNRAIIDATHDLVCAYKPNSAFYEAEGWQGMRVLERTFGAIKAIAPSVPIILDAKRADIGNTNEAYARAVFDILGADAITVHPYLGEEALKPLLERADKGIIVLCRTSNPGAGEFQDMEVGVGEGEGKFLEILGVGDSSSLGGYRTKFFLHVAYQVSRYWNRNKNCALVVGATYPEELAQVRRIVGDMPILIPAIGAQGGDLEKTVRAGMDSKGQGMIVNSSRGIIFASREADFAEVARREAEALHDAINQSRKEVIAL